MSSFLRGEGGSFAGDVDFESRDRELEFIQLIDSARWYLSDYQGKRTDLIIHN